MFQQSKNKIGALWLKTAKKSGLKYMSGTIEWKGEKFYISVFRNKFTSNEKSPQYSIVWNSKEVYDNQNENSQGLTDDVPF